MIRYHGYGMSGRIVGHIDMDAFFASVEERDKPFLRGQPVVVGADPAGGAGRGVVSTANYAARRLGIGSAMPIRSAWRRCEALRSSGSGPCVFLTPDFRRYNAASHEVFTIVRAHVPRVEQTSIDEAYLDLSFCASYTQARRCVRELKRSVAKHTQLTCSVGIGSNKMVAKIASDYEKPDGLTVVYPRNTEAFLRPLPIRALPGIGKKAEQTFNRLNIHTVGDAQRLSWEELQRLFGGHGFSIWERVRGIDRREVSVMKPMRKSIGKHHTFREDTHDMHHVLATVRAQCKAIFREMRRHGFTTFRTVVLTVRFEDYTTVTRSLTLERPLRTARQLELKAIKLLLPFFERAENPQRKALRLVGVRVEKLV